MIPYSSPVVKCAGCPNHFTLQTLITFETFPYLYALK